MPPPPKDVKTGKNIADSVKGTGSHNTLAAALAAAKLEGALSGADKLCLFAPTDDAFAKLPAGAQFSLPPASLQLVTPSRFSLALISFLFLSIPPLSSPRLPQAPSMPS